MANDWDEVIADNTAYIDELRDQLAKELDKASSALISARKCIQELTKNSVYDIAFVEGDGHIERAVEHAGLYVAAAQAMTAVLLE